jgi:hypothetical protein
MEGVYLVVPKRRMAKSGGSGAGGGSLQRESNRVRT